MLTISRLVRRASDDTFRITRSTLWWRWTSYGFQVTSRWFRSCWWFSTLRSGKSSLCRWAWMLPPLPCGLGHGTWSFDPGHTIMCHHSPTSLITRQFPLVLCHHCPNTASFLFFEYGLSSAQECVTGTWQMEWFFMEKSCIQTLVDGEMSVPAVYDHRR